jgi:hypothetical protein
MHRIELVEMADRASDTTAVVSAKDVALRMKMDYSRGIKDYTSRDLEAVCGLCWKLEQPNLDINSFIRETADLISKLFGIESVAIGVMDPVDRLYKYRVVVGLDNEVAEGFKGLAYTREQLLEASSYPCYTISERTKLFLAEDHPYAKGEEFTYRRPGLIGMKRRELTDSLEADYLDFFFYGPDGEILGFIETSGTRMRKLPDSLTIRWIELIAGILSVALQKKK